MQKVRKNWRTSRLYKKLNCWDAFQLFIDLKAEPEHQAIALQFLIDNSVTDYFGLQKTAKKWIKKGLLMEKPVITY